VPPGRGCMTQLKLSPSPAAIASREERVKGLGSITLKVLAGS